MREEIKLILLLQTAMAGASLERGRIYVFPDVSLEYQYLLHSLFDVDRVELERVPLVAPDNFYGAIDTMPDIIALPERVFLPEDRPVWEPEAFRDLYRCRKSRHQVRHTPHRRGCRHR